MKPPAKSALELGNVGNLDAFVKVRTGQDVDKVADELDRKRRLRLHGFILQKHDIDRKAWFHLFDNK